MEQLIERLKATLDDVLEIKKSFEAKKSQVAELKQKQDKVAVIQGEKEIELEKREEAVKPIENIVTFKQAAEELAEMVNDGRILLDKAKNAFEVYRKNETAKLTTKIAEVNKSKELYERELIALQEAKEEVAKAKTNIKSIAIGELAKNL